MSLARERLEGALARITDPAGEGKRACLTVYTQSARDAADAADARTRDGISLGALDGAIVSIKDLLDVAGEVTRAGSKVIAEEGKPALSDAPVVQRLRAAGAVIIGKTNMTEFALSGVGINPHFGTPGNPADRARIPGGSTSGGAVAVADGMCEIAIGSDTGGSTRIPAALCGIVGYKPSRQRIPTEGVFPLSYTLDSIGCMASTVALCAAADAAMAGEASFVLQLAPLMNLRVGITQGAVLDRLDDTVSKRFSAALDRLEKAGVRLSAEKLPLIERMNEINRKGGVLLPEALSIHRAQLARRGGDIDPNVRARLERAAAVSAPDYIAMKRERAALIGAMDARLADLDVLAMPTTAIVAPRIADLSEAEAFARQNAILLRNTTPWNFFDCCAISLPLPRDGALPAGFMLAARNGYDRRLFRIAAAMERIISG